MFEIDVEVYQMADDAEYPVLPKTDKPFVIWWYKQDRAYVKSCLFDEEGYEVVHGIISDTLKESLRKIQKEIQEKMRYKFIQKS